MGQGVCRKLLLWRKAVEDQAEVEERAPHSPNPSHPAGARTRSLPTDFPFFHSFFNTLVAAWIQVSSDTDIPVSNTLLVFYRDFIYISQGSLEKQSQYDLYTYRKRCHMRDWLMWLWRQRSPTVCCLQGGGPGKLVLWFQARLNTKNQEHWCLRAGEDPCPSLGRQNIPPSSAFLFYPSRQRIGLYLLCVGEDNLLHSVNSTPIQMLISSRDTLTDEPRNNVLPAIWTHLSPVKLHKINHYTSQVTSQGETPILRSSSIKTCQAFGKVIWCKSTQNLKTNI